MSKDRKIIDIAKQVIDDEVQALIGLKNYIDKNFEEIQESFASAKSQHIRSIVNVENAKIALDDTLVKSPLNATIISRPVEVGQVISSPTSAVGGGTVLMRMADLSKVRIRAYVDEIDIGKVKNINNKLIKISPSFFILNLYELSERLNFSITWYLLRIKYGGIRWSINSHHLKVFTTKIPLDFKK